MRYFSMFSGVEGFGLGIPNGEPIGFSEIDKYASMVLRYHFPNVKNYGDCRTIQWNEVPDFDILTGGSPCQDFSIAGKRRGLGGARSSLAWEFIRALRDKKPRYFLWENVKGVLSSRGGWDFANLISAFSESGYALWWQVLNAKDFGVPQNRERIFIFGFREGNPKEVFFESKDSRQVKDVGTTKPNDRIGQHDRVFGQDGIIGALGAVDYKQPPQILVQNKGESQYYRIYDENGLSPTLQSQSGMSSQKHPFIIDTNNKREYNGKYEMQKMSKQVNSQVVSKKQKVGGLKDFSKKDILRLGMYEGNNDTSLEKGSSKMGRKLSGKTTFQENRDMRNMQSNETNRNTPQRRKQIKQQNNKSPRNLSGMPYQESPNQSKEELLEKAEAEQIGAFRIRRLMPCETEALMSWPDDWTHWGINEKGEKVEISDSQRYKMCGNGVVSNVVREIMKVHLS